VKTTLIVAGALALLASGCGRMADLEAPPARETERAQRGAEAEPLPEPATVNRPSSQQPIDGGPTNPFGASAAGRDQR
jgi:predicted small lipoprotein YifL